jgi:hypothetical protein
MLLPHYKQNDAPIPPNLLLLRRAFAFLFLLKKSNIITIP